MERIGEYRVRRLVGEGGMGRVYEAEERLSKRRVALKVLRAELSRSERARRMFENEMSILAHLDHKNIVRCLSCSEIDGQLVLVLEFLEGRTLREVCEKQRLSCSEAVSIVAQVGSALKAAHEQSPPVVHRDLKPENIMVLDDGTVKVTDFGIAKVLEAVSQTSTHSAGTLAYMSPEQIDAHQVDARSDLYALGLILYELLAGAPPFRSASPRELLNMQCCEPPPALPERVRAAIPRGIEALLFGLLQKSPDDRPVSAEAMLRALGPFVPATAVALGDWDEAGALSIADTELGPELSDAHDTEPSVPDLFAPGAAANRESKSSHTGARRMLDNTAALIERISVGRDWLGHQLSRRTSAVVLCIACLLSAALTYAVRRATLTEAVDGRAEALSQGTE